jgi:hypothetical protein
VVVVSGVLLATGQRKSRVLDVAAGRQPITVLLMIYEHGRHSCLRLALNLSHFDLANIHESIY